MVFNMYCFTFSVFSFNFFIKFYFLKPMIQMSKKHLYQRNTKNWNSYLRLKTKYSYWANWIHLKTQVGSKAVDQDGNDTRSVNFGTKYTNVHLCPKKEVPIWYLSLKLSSCFVNPLLRVRQRYNKQKRRRSSHVAAVMRSRTPSNWYLRLQPLSFAAYEKNSSKQCAITYSNAMYRRYYKTKKIVC